VVVTGSCKQDDLLVTGFLREFTDDNGYNVANDLLNELFKWHSQSMMHWIEFGSAKILKDDILQFPCPCC